MTVQMASSSLHKSSRLSAPPQTMAASAFATSPLYAQIAEALPALDGEGTVLDDPVDNPEEEIQLHPPSEEEFLTPEKVAELQPDETQAGQAIRFAWPVNGTITSRFGPRGRELHRGVDIGAPYGKTVKAAKGGVVTLSNWYARYGQTVIIRHPDGTETLYAHASRLLVSAGEQVAEGQPIALVGSSGRSTGPHLHFEIRLNGRAVNPLAYLGR